MLGSHGLFTWGYTAYESYLNTLEVIERCAGFLDRNISPTVFGGNKIKPVQPGKRRLVAASIAPILRGLCSSPTKMIGHFTDDERVMEFINSNALVRLGSLGTSCPDHFLRTKIAPLILDLSPEENLDEVTFIKEKLSVQFEAYRKMYHDYYETWKHPDSLDIEDVPNQGSNKIDW